MGILDFLFKQSSNKYELKYKEAERKYYRNEYASAIVDLKALLSEYDHYQCFGLMGSCYFELKKYEEALAFYKKSIKKEPSLLMNTLAHDRIEAIEEILLKQKANVELDPKAGKNIIDIDGNSYVTIVPGISICPDFHFVSVLLV